jgi:hypothetical protein
MKHEGDPDGFFDDNVQDAMEIDNDGNFVPKLDQQVLFATNHAEDIVMVCN